MIIQFALIIASGLILIYFLANQNSLRVRAYKKIALILFVIAMIVFVISPDSLNTIAHKLGVGRGADLLLYLLFVSFVIFALNSYIKFNTQEEKLHKLTRKIALLEAENEYNKRIK